MKYNAVIVCKNMEDVYGIVDMLDHAGEISQLKVYIMDEKWRNSEFCLERKGISMDVSVRHYEKSEGFVGIMKDLLQNESGTPFYIAADAGWEKTAEHGLFSADLAEQLSGEECYVVYEPGLNEKIQVWKEQFLDSKWRNVYSFIKYRFPGI